MKFGFYFLFFVLILLAGCIGVTTEFKPATTQNNIGSISYGKLSEPVSNNGIRVIVEDVTESKDFSKQSFLSILDSEKPIIIDIAFENGTSSDYNPSFYLEDDKGFHYDPRDVGLDDRDFPFFSKIWPSKKARGIARFYVPKEISTPDLELVVEQPKILVRLVKP